MQRTRSGVGGCASFNFVLYIGASLKRNVVCWCIHKSRIVFVVLQNSFKNWVFVFVRVLFRSSSFCASVKVQSSSGKGGLSIPWCSCRGSQRSLKVHQILKQQEKLHRANILFWRIIALCNIVTKICINWVSHCYFKFLSTDFSFISVSYLKAIYNEI